MSWVQYHFSLLFEMIRNTKSIVWVYMELLDEIQGASNTNSCLDVHTVEFGIDYVSSLQRKKTGEGCGGGDGGGPRRRDAGEQRAVRRRREMEGGRRGGRWRRPTEEEDEGGPQRRFARHAGGGRWRAGAAHAKGEGGDGRKEMAGRRTWREGEEGRPAGGDGGGGPARAKGKEANGPV